MPVPPSLGLHFNIVNCVFCPVQLQLVIFNFEEEGTGTEHVAIATSKCVPSGVFRKLLSFNSITSLLAEMFLIFYYTTVFAQPMMPSVAKFA